MDFSQVSVLLVEDSKTQGLLLKKLLTENGIQVHEAGDGREALDKLEHFRPDVVISDVCMPRVSGFELCREIRSKEALKDLPVIIYTVLYDPKEMLTALEVGADYFLTKSSAHELLLHFIEEALHIRSRRSIPIDLECFVRGEVRRIEGDFNRVMTLFISTYENAVERNRAVEAADKKVRENNIQLQLLDKEKNRFLAMAAHDLRNPLGVIQGYAEFLEERLKDQISSECMDMVHTIQLSTQRILQMVNEFLDVSVIESGQLTLKTELVDLGELFEKNIQLNQILSDKKQIKISLDKQGEVPQVICDRDKIEQVLTNYVTNAIKYSDPGTEVVIHLGINDQNVEFSVEDHGQGLSEEDLSKLFKRFSKTTAKTTAGEQSVGLGLSIVKKMVEAHDGKVWVESERGKGSRFYASFPMKSDSSLQKDQAA